MAEHRNVATAKRRHGPCDRALARVCANVSLSADRLAGDFAICADCRAELVVASIAQPTLTLAPEVDDDWGQ